MIFNINVCCSFLFPNVSNRTQIRRLKSSDLFLMLLNVHFFRSQFYRTQIEYFRYSYKKDLKFLKLSIICKMSKKNVQSKYHVLQKLKVIANTRTFLRSIIHRLKYKKYRNYQYFLDNFKSIFLS